MSPCVKPVDIGSWRNCWSAGSHCSFCVASCPRHLLWRCGTAYITGGSSLCFGFNFHTSVISLLLACCGGLPGRSIQRLESWGCPLARNRRSSRRIWCWLVGFVENAVWMVSLAYSILSVFPKDGNRDRGWGGSCSRKLCVCTVFTKFHSLIWVNYLRVYMDQLRSLPWAGFSWRAVMDMATFQQCQFYILLKGDSHRILEPLGDTFTKNVSCFRELSVASAHGEPTILQDYVDLPYCVTTHCRTHDKV